MKPKKQNKFSVIIVLGPPGSGKGTQTNLLAKKFGFHHFISSQLGRDYMAAHDDEQTKKQKERYDKGLLFDPKWIFKVVEEKTLELFKEEEHNCPGIIFDGSPRTLSEAKDIYKFLVKNIGKENIKIVRIEISEKETIRRLKKRLICSNDGKHVFIRSPKMEAGASCPENDGILKERDLDKQSLFATRIKAYKKETVPGLKFLNKVHGVFRINGEQGENKVHKNIIKALGL